MVENARRTLLLIACLVIGSILLLVVPERPIKLGLDLAGGVRLVYGLDFEEAYKSGALDRNTPQDKVIEDTIAIIRGRIDPQGVLNPTIRRLGSTRIEISLPRSVQVTGAIARAPIGKALGGEGDPNLMAAIELAGADPAEFAKFPGAGGVVEIDREKIRYSGRVDNLLTVEHRGEAGTSTEPHAAGAVVTLVSDDQVERLITELGDMQFYIAAKDTDFTAAGKDEKVEKQKAVDWLKKPENALVAMKTFNALPPDKGGPPPGFRWFPTRNQEGKAKQAREDTLLAVVVPKPEWVFTGGDLESVSKSVDKIGFPAVSFQMVPSKVGPFGDFTGSHVKEPMVIVLNDEIVSYATIGERLPGQAQIYGRFTDVQVDNMVKVLRSGSLQIKPILQQREDVGATLGQESIDQGWIMSLLALGLIVGFMCWYFRLLGVYASIGLAINLLMQLGAMVAFQATLTMPGIAGIILGIGMAVDANILIFARIREEQMHGKKPLQAAKAGFENALSAIVDGNVTTVLAGIILYYLGTGPIRGFAVNLIISVITSMFAALVIVRLFIHYRLEKKPNEPFQMKSWLADANYDVLGKTKIAIGGSLVIMAAGLILFFWLPDKQKLGIDFLGGATLKVRTAQAQLDTDLRAKVQGLGGDFGSAEVAGLPSSRVAPGKYTQFRITFKSEFKAGEEVETAGSETIFKDVVRKGLADVLQPDRLELTQTQGAESSSVTGTLYFDAAHPVEDVKARLEASKIELKDVTVSIKEPERKDTFAFTATTRPGVDDIALKTSISDAIVGHQDSGGKDLLLAEQIPEASVIGKQVVGELRDSALKALLLSMIVTVLYIRVRFAEYSYGFAAVLALVHDLIITVGAIAFLVWVPWIHIEFDMGTIAVFLTIVGYSINDTIVVFDRIRENRPRRKGSLEEIVNASINETFSRTIITSTSMLTIFIVLIFNLGTGNSLESFAFAMTFGIATGTFSSIYIASPIFIWLEKRQQRKDEEDKKREEMLARSPGSKAPTA